LSITASNSNLDPQTSATMNNVAEGLKHAKGKISIQIKQRPALSIALNGDTVLVDIEDPSIFGLAESDTSVGIFDGLKTAKKLGEMLNSKGLTLSILRKGKKAVSLGRDAAPTISSFVTGSDDIQVDSVSEVAKLGKDIKKSRKNAKRE
jgi:hypothetical protein